MMEFCFAFNLFFYSCATKQKSHKRSLLIFEGITKGSLIQRFPPYSTWEWALNVVVEFLFWLFSALKSIDSVSFVYGDYLEMNSFRDI